MNAVPVANARISLSADCIELVEALVRRLGGDFTYEGAFTVPPMPEKERPGRMLKGLRLRENLTQKQVAAALQVPQSHISEYEKGKRPIPPAKAELLASLLHSVPENFLYR